jgi:aromatic ring-opening dioxygenase LigB subunit
MRGCVCPHPPLLVPEIGRSNRDEVQATVAAMERLAETIGEVGTAVIISPHTPTYFDAFTVKSAPELAGDFAAFGCPHIRHELPNDVEFVETLLAAASGAHVPLEPSSDAELDHGILVPLTFLRTRSLVSLSIVGGYPEHRRLGRLVRTVAERLHRDLLFIASGDLSHRLTRGAPAGYDERGPAFDRRVVELLSKGDFDSLEKLDGDLVQRAGECGLRSLVALGGFLGADASIDPQVLSYEGPFGVGYLVAGFGLAAT